jgi:hypothetical protein
MLNPGLLNKKGSAAMSPGSTATIDLETEVVKQANTTESEVSIRGLVRSTMQEPGGKPLLVLKEHTDQTPLLMVVNQGRTVVVQIVLMCDPQSNQNMVEQAVGKYLAIAEQSKLNLITTLLITQEEPINNQLRKMKIYGYFKSPNTTPIPMSAGSLW